MPIKTNIEGRFSKEILKNILYTHRLGMLLGLIFPLFLFFLVGALTGSFFGIWPTVFEQSVEYLYLYGWAAMYVFGLVFLVYPEIIDVLWTKRQYAAFRLFINAYALGMILYVGGIIAAAFIGEPAFTNAFFLVGTCVSLVAWLGACAYFFRLLHKKRQDVLHQSVLASMIPFTASLVVLPLVILFVASRDAVIIPVTLHFLLRFLPLAGIGFIALTMLVRLVPEMLYWRPVEERELRLSYAILLVSATMAILGYLWFHESYTTLSAATYVLGVLGVLSGVMLLYSTLDFWRIRLDRSDHKEHVSFVYGSLIWLMISLLVFLVLTIVEVKIGSRLPRMFGDTLLVVFMTGFVAQAIIGLYVYVTAQSKGAHAHRDFPATFVFTVVNWALVLRLLIYPMMLFSAWPGVELFKSFLDVLLFVSLFIMSFDLLHGIGGHRFQKRG